MEGQVGLRQNPAEFRFVGYREIKNFNQLGNDADEEQSLTNATEFPVANYQEKHGTQHERKRRENKVFCPEKCVVCQKKMA